MSYQIGLPILILKEAGVVEEGVLDRGVIGMYMPEFNLEDDSEDDSEDDHYLHSKEWEQISELWEGRVKDFYHGKSDQVPRAKDVPTREKRISSPDALSALNATGKHQTHRRPKAKRADTPNFAPSEDSISEDEVPVPIPRTRPGQSFRPNSSDEAFRQLELGSSVSDTPASDDDGGHL